MTEQQFCYWLNGFAELNVAPPTPEQWQSIREHLATVFVKVTPPVFTMPDELKKMLDRNQTVAVPHVWPQWVEDAKQKPFRAGDIIC